LNEFERMATAAAALAGIVYGIVIFAVATLCYFVFY